MATIGTLSSLLVFLLIKDRFLAHRDLLNSHSYQSVTVQLNTISSLYSFYIYMCICMYTDEAMAKHLKSWNLFLVSSNYQLSVMKFSISPIFKY